MRIKKSWSRVLLPCVLLLAALTEGAVKAALPVTLYQEPDGQSPQHLDQAYHSVFWWNSGSGGPEFGNTSVLRWQTDPPLSFRAVLRRPTRTQTIIDQAADSGVMSAGRDATYFYFIAGAGPGNKLYRKPVNASATDPAQVIPPTGLEPNNFTYDVAGVWKGKLYYVVDGQVFFLGRQLHNWQLWSYDPANPTPQYQGEATGPAIQTMRFASYYPPTSLAGFGAATDGAFLLGTDGTLTRFDLDGSSKVTPLTGGVRDFVIQNQFSRTPLGGVLRSETVIYASKTPSTGGGILGFTLFIVNPNSGSAMQQAIDPSSPLASQPSVANLASDDRFVFASVVTSGMSYSLKARDAAASAPAWYFIAESLPGAVNSLVSDGNWLYFTDGKLVQYLPTDAAPLELDLRALGLEAVQTIQNLHNEVQWVADKPAFVRVYADLATNTTGLTSWYPTAALHGVLNGTEMPDSPISPTIHPPLTLNASPGSLRSTTANAFLFEVPITWVQAGQLTLTASLDPAHALPESGPLSNNSVTAIVTILPARVPALVFVPLANSLPNYEPALDPSFGDILDRAKSLLPVSDWHVFFNSGPVYKKTFRVRTGREVCPPIVPCFSSPVPLPGIDDDLFDVPNDQDEFVLWTVYYSMFNHDPAGAADVHWIGMLPTAAPGFNGIGEMAGMKPLDLVSGLPDILKDLVNPALPSDLAAVIRMASESGTVPWGSIQGGFNLAHELGHNYGRKHINQTIPVRFTNCGTQTPAGPYDTYPYDPCSLGFTDFNNPATFFGFDSRSLAVVPPDQAGDLMSYANAVWTSDYTWTALLQAIPAGSDASPQDGLPASMHPSAQAGPLTLVSGHVNWEAQTVKMLPFYTLPRDAFDPNSVSQCLQALTKVSTNYPMALRLLDGSGAVLASYPLILLPGGDGVPGEFDFAQLVPFVDGTRRLQAMRLGVLVAERVVSPSAPAIELGTPVTDGQSVALSWTASDPDGDSLAFAIQYSADQGQSWLMLDPLYDGLSITIDTSRLPGGDAVLLRVNASDGVNSTAATTSPFAIPKHAPEILLMGALENQRFPFAGPKYLHALAMDAEEGSLPPASLSWSFTGPGAPAVATRDVVSLAGLPPGAYSVTVQATDRDGQTGTATRDFQIGPVVVPDGDAPIVDGLGSDPGYAQAVTLRLPLAGGQFARVNLLHAAGALYVSFADLPYAPGGAAPAQATLLLNTTGGAEDAPSARDLGFVVDESGVPSQLLGDGTTISKSLSPAAGFNAAVFQGNNSWSAEFSIAESLLGGWNHAAALMLSLQAPGGGIWPSAAGTNAPGTWAAASLGVVSVPQTQLPVAIVSAPRTYNLSGSQNILLDGSASYDPAGQPLTFSWLQTGGPALTLSNSTSAGIALAVTPDLAPASLEFQLIVNNGQTNSAPAQTTVTLRSVPSQATALVDNPPTDTLAAGPNGEVSGGLIVPGQPGDSFVIQASIDLTNWTAIATNTLDYFEKISFLDPDTTLYPQRFYRATSNPQPLDIAGAALELPGGTAMVQVAAAPDLNPFPLSITFWLQTTDMGADARGLVTKYEDSSFNGYALFLSAGHVRGWFFKDSVTYVWDGSLGLDSGMVADGQWHHLAVVVDQSGGSLSVDGTQASTLNWTGTPGAPASTQPLQFGRYATYPVSLNGAMDEITLWNRALAPSEIADFKNHSLTGFEPGLVGYWKCNEGKGTVARDSAEHGHDGTLLNGAAWTNSGALIYP